MRLADLNPRWSGSSGRSGAGVTFDCPGPCCAGKPSVISTPEGSEKDYEGSKERLYVPFRNPIDGGDPIMGEPRWNRIGETFDTLSLTPSVDASRFGHWHGFVREGNIE